jgi:secernin
MCDTIVAAGPATLDGSVILAKNSDREPNEAQLLKHILVTKHLEGADQKCTYVSIPSTLQTNEVLISKPSWMWGCEMGVNSFGVAIGNEAVFTREPYEKLGLIGMDLIRIALERTETAYDALLHITNLIDEFGQGGNCGFRQKLYYHNSFIITDQNDVWVLETANKHWIAKKIEGIYTISNGLTIETDFDLASQGIEEYARKKRYLKKNEPFNFKKAFSDKFYTHFSRCRVRRNRTYELLQRNFGKLTPTIMMNILRDHGDDNRYLHPHETSMGTVCMHASFGPLRPSQSTSALVVHHRDTFPVYWATGTSGTCTSIFKPFYLTGKEIDFFPNTETLTFSYDSYWWKHELLHRQAIIKYNSWLNNIVAERDELENKFIEEDSKLYQRILKNDKNYSDKLAVFSKECFNISDEKCSVWIKRLNNSNEDKDVPYRFKRFWEKQNKLASLSENYELINE